MEKTVAAISTGLTPSGIAIIRISGPASIEVADRVFVGKKALSKAKSHTVHYGHVLSEGNVIDEVLVSVFRAPHTYTGEDTVEINCHGGLLVTRKILETVLANGAEPAAPGEFTKRAFLNGRMDLARAEAVMDVIEAQNNFALKAGVSGLKGEISDKIREIRTQILDECAFIEAALDDPEHYDLTGYGSVLSERILPIRETLSRMIERADYGSMLKEGVRTVIAGKPNAGKSSVLNLLSGYDKAIVTDIAGTTRDILEVPVVLKDISLLLTDTAGLRETADSVEKIGVERAKNAILAADLILYVIDAFAGVSAEDLQNIQDFSDKPVLVLLNKSDLFSEASEEKDAAQRESLSKALSGRENAAVISFSCVSGNGREELEQAIIRLFGDGKISFNNEVVITGERQKALMKDAFSSLELVLRGISEGLSEEFLTVDLVNAYTRLGEIIGEEVTDDVVDRVFKKFCMGK